MNPLLIFVLVGLSLPSRIKADDLFYSNTSIRMDYQLFINDKELLVNGYAYKLRTRYKSDSGKYMTDWRIANWLKSEIDGKLFPAIAR